MNLLVNLPRGFYHTPALEPVFARLASLGDVRRASHDTPEQIGPDLAWADAALMWSWPKLLPPLLDRAPRLRFVGHIDLSQSAARVALDRGLAISVGRSGFSPAVAEMALALILAALRKTSDYHAAMRRGDETWVRSFPDDIDPLERELSGRPVGIIGFGRVGRRLAELLQPFDGAIRAYDPFVLPHVARAAGVELAPLDALIAGSDVVVLSAASNAEGGGHLIGRGQIDACRRDAVFVNVARAALVDTAALVDRLRRGDLTAAVDVFDAEPLPLDHPLRGLPNAYLTPHRGGGLMASVTRILNGLIDDLARFEAGEPLAFPLTQNMLSALDQ
jgi:phosphoglycerate dehydrogenase-like enzyme